MIAVTALFLSLVFAHLLGDYPLQGDFLARAKNHRHPLPGVPATLALLSHAAIQAGLTSITVYVFLVASVSVDRAARVALLIGTCELTLHTYIDYLKCNGDMGQDQEVAYYIDQACHVACKLVWLMVIMAVLAW